MLRAGYTYKHVYFGIYTCTRYQNYTELTESGAETQIQFLEIMELN